MWHKPSDKLPECYTDDRSGIVRYRLTPNDQIRPHVIISVATEDDSNDDGETGYAPEDCDVLAYESNVIATADSWLN